MKETTVYFVLSPSTGMVKIGKTSRDPEQRLKGLQGGSPDKLEVVLTLEARPPFEESQLHWRFRNYRKHGEWFEYSKSIQDFVESKRRDPKPNWSDDSALGHPDAEGVACYADVESATLYSADTHRVHADGAPYGINPGWVQWETYKGSTLGRNKISRPTYSWSRDES